MEGGRNSVMKRRRYMDDAGGTGCGSRGDEMTGKLMKRMCAERLRLVIAATMVMSGAMASRAATYFVDSRGGRTRRVGRLRRVRDSI